MTGGDSQALIDRLPHRPPMRLIDRVESARSDRAVCWIRVGDDLCQLFGDGKSADSYIGIEVIAQSAAIALACSQQDDRPLAGMLVQVSRFLAAVPAVSLGSELRCSVRIDLAMEGRFGLAEGTVHCGDALICSGTLSLAINR